MPRETLYDSPSDDRDPAILCLKDGTLVVSFYTWDSWRTSPALCQKYATETARMEKEGWDKYSGSFVIVSSDGGRRWSCAAKAPVFSPHGTITSPDGSLCWLGLSEVDGRSVVQIYRSQDLAVTWHRLANVAHGKPLGAAPFCSDSGGMAEAGTLGTSPMALSLSSQRAVATFGSTWTDM